jgi:hypothetical protein
MRVTGTDEPIVHVKRGSRIPNSLAKANTMSYRNGIRIAPKTPPIRSCSHLMTATDGSGAATDRASVAQAVPDCEIH